MNTGGLSLDQAPPLGVPLRFFVTAPLFLALAALLLLVRGPEVFASRWTPAALAVTHLITIGFLAQIMIGALLQLLPVLVGAKVPAVSGFAAMVHSALTIGAVMLAGGFLSGQAGALALGAGFLGLGFLAFIAAAGAALWRVPGARHTAWAMRLALAALLVTAVLGGVLVWAMTGELRLAGFQRWVDVHLAWGLAGWGGLLLIGVASELAPMFYMTQRYPAALRGWLAPAGFALLALWSLLGVFDARASAAVGFLLGALFLLFVGVLQWLLARRKRPVKDATLFFVGFANLTLALGVLAWLAGASGIWIGLFLLAGTALAFPMGMLYKIVPFLCWFHLQGIQLRSELFDRPLPWMKGFISEAQARWQFASFIAAWLALALAVPWPEPFARIGGGLLLLSALFFLANLLGAVRRFRREAAWFERQGAAQSVDG